MTDFAFYFALSGNFDDDVLRGAAALCGVELVWAMAERAGELPSILGAGSDLLDQPHVMGIIVNKRNQGFIAGLTGNCIRLFPSDRQPHDTSNAFRNNMLPPPTSN